MSETEDSPNELELAFMKAESGGETVSLDLHGMAADQAEAAMDRSLNSEFMSGHRFLRIIHGKGTGRLQQAVEKFLSVHPLVDGWRPSSVSGEQGAVIYVILAEKE